METQYRLLESAWPREVLKLPSCKEVVAAGGSVLFRGPRVRMGIHWAGEGTVAHRHSPSHTLVRHQSPSQTQYWSAPGHERRRVCETALLHTGSLGVTVIVSWSDEAYVRPCIADHQQLVSLVDAPEGCGYGLD